MLQETIVTPADILLPPYPPESEDWARWAVIACDQFTSEPEYWKDVEKTVDGHLSTLDLILPEVYLGTAVEQEHNRIIAKNMQSICEKLRLFPDSMVYLERTLPDGRVRRGMIGKIDLEAYDYTPASHSAIRPTEATVVERIPPRVAVRRGAAVELPHVMLLMDDPKDLVIAPLADKKPQMERLYRFPLMLGGGYAAGYLVTGDVQEQLLEALRAYETRRQGSVVYAVGDGNHSLASAAAYYRELKDTLGDDVAKAHPARYALVEIVNLHDPALEFEPIYRLLKHCDPEDVLAALESVSAGKRKATAVTAAGERHLTLPEGHALDVGCLQEFIDGYIKTHPGVVCDYIHGEDSLRTLSAGAGCLGFFCSGVDKETLFSYVAENGPLPRKTFSMGEAKSKRYYLEARKIVS